MQHKCTHRKVSHKPSHFKSGCHCNKQALYLIPNVALLYLEMSVARWWIVMYKRWKLTMVVCKNEEPAVICRNSRHLLSRHRVSRNRVSRHSGYVDGFVKSRILSLYILYTFIPYKSTFVSWHFAYLNMFSGPKQCFHA